MPKAHCACCCHCCCRGVGQRPLLLLPGHLLQPAQGESSASKQQTRSCRLPGWATVWTTRICRVALHSMPATVQASRSIPPPVRAYRIGISELLVNCKATDVGTHIICGMLVLACRPGPAGLWLTPCKASAVQSVQQQLQMRCGTGWEMHWRQRRCPPSAQRAWGSASQQQWTVQRCSSTSR
jgi:hypothetical protein